MTAKRTRRTGHIEKAALVEIFLGSTATLQSGMTLHAPNPRASPKHFWVPPTDVYESGNKIIVLTEIAGVEAEDLTVTLTGRQLNISGIRRDHTPGPRAYHRLEVHFGEFRTTVDLPARVDENDITAEYHKGFLRLTFTKLESA